VAKEKFIIVVGASAGGSMVLPELLRQIHSEMHVAVFVVLHLSKRSIGDLLVKRLQKSTDMKCEIPANGTDVEAGCVYIAKPDHHLMVRDNRILIGKGAMENRYRPSVDALFRSAAVEYNSRAIGIILSGLLEDGVAGMQAIKRCGGSCIVQMPEEAKYADMPLSVLRNLHPDYTISVEEMGRAIAKIMKKPRKKEKVPLDLAREAQIAASVNIGIDALDDVSTHSLYSCPDCGGGLWEFKSNGISHYRCHVGHAFTEDGLLGAMESSTESALWMALRIIEERKNLLKNIAANGKSKGMRQTPRHYEKRIHELDTQIRQLRKVLFDTEQD
jgi:two-component system, chemotaxis family, protein-glutamate methylesterase/glutaminase